jgi:hypothetical protein
LLAALDHRLGGPDLVVGPRRRRLDSLMSWSPFVREVWNWNYSEENSD